MELYRSHRDNENKSTRSHSPVMMASGAAAALIIAGTILVLVTGRPAQWYQGVVTTIRTIHVSLLGGMPEFVSMTVEKNGADYEVRKGDIVEISYRDEFAVTRVETDTFSMKGISIDVSDIGTNQDAGRLMKGIDIIDGVMTSKKEPIITVRARETSIAVIPIKVILSPQDWLRYAQQSKEGTDKIRYLEKAVQMKGEDTEARRSLARMYITEGDVQKGIAAYREILTKNPDDMSTLIELSDIYMQVRKYGDAIRLYEQIISSRTNDAAAYANMAYARGQLGKWNESARDYEKSLALNPGMTEVRYRLAEAYEKLNNKTKAVAEYEKIVKASIESKAAMLRLADHYLNVKEYDRAIQYYLDVLKRDSALAAVHANLGIAYSGKGMIDKEIESYKKSISIDSRNPVVHYNLALACEKAGKHKESEDELRKVLRLKPGEPDASEKLAGYHEQRKEYKEAIAVLKKSSAASTRSDAYVHIARLYAEDADFNNALRYYELAAKHGADENVIAEKITGLKIKMLQKKYKD